MTKPSMTDEKRPVLVIRCDVCQTVTPGHLGPSVHTPPLTETERLAELKREGWTLTPSRDLCPRCRAFDRAR